MSFLSCLSFSIISPLSAFSMKAMGLQVGREERMVNSSFLKWRSPHITTWEMTVCYQGKTSKKPHCAAAGKWCSGRNLVLPGEQVHSRRGNWEGKCLLKQTRLAL